MVTQAWIAHQSDFTDAVIRGYGRNDLADRTAPDSLEQESTAARSLAKMWNGVIISRQRRSSAR
jgi:hypothetical protein